MDNIKLININGNKDLITEQDILNLLTVKNNFGFKYKNKVQNYKNSVLRSIYNSPFVLCDQECLSLNVKKILPSILKLRYDIEMKELKYLLESGYITPQEFLEELEYLKFCYYDSSIEGSYIFKKGYINVPTDNKIKIR